MLRSAYFAFAAAGLLGLSVALYSASEPKTPKGNAGAGKKAYTAKCLVCHGKDGTGSKALSVQPVRDPGLLKQYGTPEKIKKAIVAGIKPGKGQKVAMPAFKATLKPQEVDDLVAYMWQLQHPKGKPSPK